MTETTNPAPAVNSAGFRVRAKVTFVGEYFVPADEYIRTDADALWCVQSGLAFTDPDEFRASHTGTLVEPVFVVDDDGAPVPAYVEKVARDWADIWLPDNADEFAARYVTYVADQTRLNDPVRFPDDFYRIVLDQGGRRVTNIIARSPEFPATDTITPAGGRAAFTHLRDINPDLSEFEASMIVDVIARDWAHGEEERVFKTLSHFVDLTGAYRVVAALVAESKGGAA